MANRNFIYRVVKILSEGSPQFSPDPSARSYVKPNDSMSSFFGQWAKRQKLKNKTGNKPENKTEKKPEEKKS